MTPRQSVLRKMAFTGTRSLGRGGEDGGGGLGGSAGWLTSEGHISRDAPVLPHLAPAQQAGYDGAARPGRDVSREIPSLKPAGHAACAPPPLPPPMPRSPLWVPALAARSQRRRRVDVCGHRAAPCVVHRHERHLAHQVVVPLGEVAAGKPRGEGGSNKRVACRWLTRQELQAAGA
jgi:hypothetical protein